MNDDSRNYLEEAIRILKGESILQPEPAHLAGLNESRLYWRTAALGKLARVAHDARRPEIARAS